MMNIVLVLNMLLPGATTTTLTFHVDCSSGIDTASGAVDAPFRSVHQAQRAIHRARRTGGGGAARTAAAGAGRLLDAVVHIVGLCELPSPLTLGAADSNVRYIGSGTGATLSAGTQINIPTSATGTTTSTPVEVDLTKFNFSSANLGHLSGRGYSGGSACILVNNFEVSAAELFYRPAGARSAAGARAYGPAQEGMMWVARYPNRQSGGLPAASDWAGISTVDNLTLTVAAFQSQLPTWRKELAGGGEAYLHGLWAWNWADSHRPLASISATGGNLTVGADDINRGKQQRVSTITVTPWKLIA